ncbi:MAG: hypothetical protein KJO29_06485, partial [Bacteroidia bacterium]|nr:hypothetical protein [Bacteroidia bacterium]
MIIYRFRLLVCMVLVSFLSVSCSDDSGTEIADSFSDNEGSVLDDAEARRGRGGSNGSGIEVSRIDSDILQDWMSLFLELDRYAYGMRPNATARALAYINMGAYETALPGMPDFVSNDRLIQGLRIDRRVNNRNLNYELALNAAYADLFDHFILNLPSAEESKIAQLEDQIFNELSQNISNRDIDESLSWGTSVASQIIAYSQTDQAA